MEDSGGPKDIQDREFQYIYRKIDNFDQFMLKSVKIDAEIQVELKNISQKLDNHIQHKEAEIKTERAFASKLRITLIGVAIPGAVSILLWLLSLLTK